MVTPEHQVGTVGTKIYIACETTTKPLWRKDGMLLKKKNRILSIDMFLVIENVQERDAGNYSCIGYFREKKNMEEKSELLVAGMVYYINKDYINKYMLGYGVKNSI